MVGGVLLHQPGHLFSQCRIQGLFGAAGAEFQLAEGSFEGFLRRLAAQGEVLPISGCVTTGQR